ncbi:uncharacterized protein LOC105316640 [Rhizophagus clarus]|uniref:Uncharacterized protein LOC105316640 n=1 Tax=Rhizophagus clarus TaxID=94130 RepID=A0A8H3KQ28_9GLOM|nr:uncharacterized protein LOC105316640 [Rhizophagus clarus]
MTRNSRRTQSHQETPEQNQINADNSATHVRPSATNISEDNHRVLQKFRSKINNIDYKLCPECNKQIPLMVLVKKMYRRCYAEGRRKPRENDENQEEEPKRFSKENNMDPGEVPEELQGVQEFTTHLPHHPSSLNILIVHHQSANDSMAFRDFKVRRNKVARVLLWLKGNNRYYANVTIDNETLNSLPEDDFIVGILPQLHDDHLIDENLDDIGNGDYVKNGDNAITRTFVRLLPTDKCEEAAINDTLDRIQNQNPHMLWPEINGSPINEFQTVGYIVRAFSTLYPTGQADLRAKRVKDIKPAEYFRHLMWYKDEDIHR